MMKRVKKILTSYIIIYLHLPHSIKNLFIYLFRKRSGMAEGNLKLPNVKTCYEVLIMWRIWTIKYTKN